MKTSKIKFLFIAFAVAGILNNNKAIAQGSVPPEVASIINMKLEEGQTQLKSLGFEICSSSLMGKKQDWFNESTNMCVTVKFDKKSKEITEVILNPATSDCQRKLEASRAVWEKYHDGQAPVSNAKIDEERQKLTDQGFTVSYWIDEISPGRSSEYWVNETTQKAMYMVWEIQGDKWVMTEKTDYKMGHNPAPSK